MKLFRRVLRLVFWIAGGIAGLVTVAAVFMAQRMIRPARQRLWASPSDLNLDFEEVQFPAQDGVRLAGWFVPGKEEAEKEGATIVLVHGWPWNRLGTAADDALSTFAGASPVDLLRLAFALQGEGYHVFMFDLRNHGESAEHAPVTFGRDEANDLLGALTYLAGRNDVNKEKIGVIGFSMGGNTLLYALPQTDLIAAGIAVQPTTPEMFADRFAQYLFGPLGRVIRPLADSFYQSAGGSRLAAYQPAFAVAGAGDAPLLYVQSKGDEWGSTEDVAQMAAASPHVETVELVDASHRFGGYQYLIDNPKRAIAFFEKHMMAKEDEDEA